MMTHHPQAGPDGFSGSRHEHEAQVQLAVVRQYRGGPRPGDITDEIAVGNGDLRRPHPSDPAIDGDREEARTEPQQLRKPGSYVRRAAESALVGVARVAHGGRADTDTDVEDEHACPDAHRVYRPDRVLPGNETGGLDRVQGDAEPSGKQVPGPRRDDGDRQERSVQPLDDTGDSTVSAHGNEHVEAASRSCPDDVRDRFPGGDLSEFQPPLACRGGALDRGPDRVGMVVPGCRVDDDEDFAHG